MLIVSRHRLLSSVILLQLSMRSSSISFKTLSSHRLVLPRLLLRSKNTSRKRTDPVYFAGNTSKHGSSIPCGTQWKFSHHFLPYPIGKGVESCRKNPTEKWLVGKCRLRPFPAGLLVQDPVC
jgi:hypothetical protein